MVACALAVPRVLRRPEPAVQLSAFAADGLELTLNFWISDPENGQGNVRSDVNLALIATLNAAGVEIPFPQRVLHTLPASASGRPCRRRRPGAPMPRQHLAVGRRLLRELHVRRRRRLVRRHPGRRRLSRRTELPDEVIDRLLVLLAHGLQVE